MMRPSWAHQRQVDAVVGVLVMQEAAVVSVNGNDNVLLLAADPVARAAFLKEHGHEVLLVLLGPGPGKESEVWGSLRSGGDFEEDEFNEAALHLPVSLNQLRQLAIGHNVRGDEDKVVADNVMAVDLAQSITEGARPRRGERPDCHGPPAAAEARRFYVRLGGGGGLKGCGCVCIVVAWVASTVCFERPLR